MTETGHLPDEKKRQDPDLCQIHGGGGNNRREDSGCVGPVRPHIGEEASESSCATGSGIGANRAQAPRRDPPAAARSDAGYRLSNVRSSSTSSTMSSFAARTGSKSSAYGCLASGRASSSPLSKRLRGGRLSGSSGPSPGPVNPGPTRKLVAPLRQYERSSRANRALETGRCSLPPRGRRRRCAARSVLATN